MDEEIPLSAAYGRDVMFIAVHAYWKEDFLEYFDMCEELFLRFDGRPLWGKLHNLRAPELRPRYPRWQEFQWARDQLDPARVFIRVPSAACSSIKVAR